MPLYDELVPENIDKFIQQVTADRGNFTFENQSTDPATLLIRAAESQISELGSPLKNKAHVKKGTIDAIKNFYWRSESTPDLCNVTLIEYKPWILIAEGPGKNNEYKFNSAKQEEGGAVGAFFDGTLFYSYPFKIKNILQVGPPYEKGHPTKYLDYVTGTPELGNAPAYNPSPESHTFLSPFNTNISYKVEFANPVSIGKGVEKIEPTITKQSSGEAVAKENPTVYRLPNVLDKQAPDFKDKEVLTASVELLYNIYIDAIKNKHAVVSHCSAGLGRSGAATLALIFLDDYDDVFIPNDPVETERRKSLTLETLRLLRPGVIQTPEQYDIAIEWAIRAKALLKERNIEITPEEKPYRPLFEYHDQILAQQEKHIEKANQDLTGLLKAKLKKLADYKTYIASDISNFKADPFLEKEKKIEPYNVLIEALFIKADLFKSSLERLDDACNKINIDEKTFLEINVEIEQINLILKEIRPIAMELKLSIEELSESLLAKYTDLDDADPTDSITPIKDKLKIYADNLPLFIQPPQKALAEISTIQPENNSVFKLTYSAPKQTLVETPPPPIVPPYNKAPTKAPKPIPPVQTKPAQESFPWRNVASAVLFGLGIVSSVGGLVTLFVPPLWPFTVGFGGAAAFFFGAAITIEKTQEKPFVSSDGRILNKIGVNPPSGKGGEAQSVIANKNEDEDENAHKQALIQTPTNSTQPVLEQTISQETTANNDEVSSVTPIKTSPKPN